MMLDVVIRPARSTDAAALSGVIVRALRETNGKDYPPEIIDRIVENFSPERVASLMKVRRVFAASVADQIVGTASLQGTAVRTVFVDPPYQHRRVGVALMGALETIARAEGVETLVVPSSVTAELFYRKLGFEPVRDEYHGQERTIVMQKPLRSNA